MSTKQDGLSTKQTQDEAGAVGDVEFAGFLVESDEAGQTLASLARKHGFAASWNEARRLVTGGKLFVAGKVVLDDAMRPRAGLRVELRLREKKPREALPGAIVFEDAQVVVFDKPAGVSSVPYDKKEVGTAMDLIRAHWRADKKRASEQALHILHRIDKDTSGLLVFAKTKVAEKILAARFRTHEIGRTYICAVHGQLTDRRIESKLIEDRGDGLRGSTRNPKLGKRAVTHVRVLETLGSRATLCEVKLETGKTHQIRIHLAENGHPLVGERVYIRDFLRAEEETGVEALPSPRLLLHAATLGFPQPLTGVPLVFESRPPEEFEKALAVLRRM